MASRTMPAATPMRISLNIVRTIYFASAASADESNSAISRIFFSWLPAPPISGSFLKFSNTFSTLNSLFPRVDCFLFFRNCSAVRPKSPVSLYFFVICVSVVPDTRAMTRFIISPAIPNSSAPEGNTVPIDNKTTFGSSSSLHCL